MKIRDIGSYRYWPIWKKAYRSYTTCLVIVPNSIVYSTCLLWIDLNSSLPGSILNPWSVSQLGHLLGTYHGWLRRADFLLIYDSSLSNFSLGEGGFLSLSLYSIEKYVVMHCMLSTSMKKTCKKKHACLIWYYVCMYVLWNSKVIRHY